MERKSHPALKYSIWFLTIIYIVGFAGLSLSFTQDVFEKLVPFNLLISLLFLLLFHRPYTIKSFLFFILAFAFGWFIEWLGVRSQMIFGTYHYLSSLGWKIAGVPIVIGC